MADPRREAAPDATPMPAPAAARSARGRMAGALHSRRRIVLPLAALLVVVVGASWWWLRGRESTDDARVRAPIHPIAPRVQGMVVAVLVKDHQAVAAGDVLFEIDRRDFEVARDRRKADFEEATARARAASTGVPVTATTTESALAGLAPPSTTLAPVSAWRRSRWPPPRRACAAPKRGCARPKPSTRGRGATRSASSRWSSATRSRSRSTTPRSRTSTLGRRRSMRRRPR